MGTNVKSKGWIWRQRIGYGSADFACNLVWQMISLYLLFFYTDVMQLTPAAISILFLAIRFIDGITDLLMGILIDKTNTKWGKSRPYILFGAPLFALAAVLAFSVPDISMNGKIIYAYVTYFFLSLMYTVVNVPLSTILPTLTDDMNERTKLATSRTFFSLLGSTVVSYFALRWVNQFGDQKTGFRTVMIIFAVISVAVFMFTFFNTKEIYSVKAQKKASVPETLKSIVHNKYWRVFIVMHFFMWGGLFIESGAMVYYFTYNIGDAKLGTIVATMFSLMPVIGNFLSPIMTTKLQKRRVFQIGAIGRVIGMVIIFVAGKNIALLLVGAAITYAARGIMSTIYWVLQADPIDYEEYRSGISASGTICALNGFAGKVWQALAGSLSAVLLGMTGYVGSASVQTAGALNAIRLLYLVIPTIFLIGSAVTMQFYKLDDELPEIMKELEKRRNNVTE